MKKFKNLIAKAKTVVSPRRTERVGEQAWSTLDAVPVNVPVPSSSSAIQISAVPPPADERAPPVTLDIAQTNSLPQPTETNVVSVDEGQSPSVPEAMSNTSRVDSSSSTVEPALHAPALEARESPITLQSIRAAALLQLKETGLLSPADYDGNASLEDILKSADEIISRDIKTPPHAEKVTGMLKSLGRRLGKFESSVDMLVGSMPQACGFNLVGMIWGVLKLFMAIERANADTIEAVVRLLDDVLTRTSRMLDLYVKMDGASRNKLPAPPVVDLYAKLIAFGIKAAKLFKLPSDKRHSLLTDIDGLIAEVKVADNRVSKLMWTEYMSFAFEVHNNERRNMIHRWLLDPDGSSSRNAIRDISLIHNTVCEKREELDTGRWFLEGEIFRKWKAHDKSFLWLRAIPGGGKTVLCSTIIEDVRALCEADPLSSLAYFYFTDRSELEDLVRSILSQLSARATPALLARLYDRYQQNRQHPPMKELVALIPSILQGFGHVYLIFDALDECPKRRELLRWLSGIISANLDGLHLLVTSRWEEDIRASLEPLIPDVIDIGGQVEEDIQMYILEVLQTDQRFTQHNWPNELQEEIRAALMKRAKGMFRWVALQLDSLEYCRIANDVYECLESLPEGLDETYDRILSKIKVQDRKWAIRVLECLAFSARVMTLEEVGEVVAFNPDNGQFDQRLPNPDAMLKICSSLITISSGTDKMKGVLTLSHFTVKEYLTSPRIQTSKMSIYAFDQAAAHTFMCRTLLAYLMRFDSPDSLSEENIVDCPLSRYAAEFWMHHAEAIQPGSEDVQRAILSLLQPQNAEYRNWIWIHNPDTPWLDPLKHWVIVPAPPLYYVSLVGMEKTTQMLIETNANVNAEGGEYGNALQAASIGGHETIVQLLIENGANVNAEGGEYGNALQAASTGGDEAIVQLLIENGANVNAEGGGYGNALQAASAGAHQAIVRLLIENGANVNAEGGEYGNALQAASARGHEAIVQVLIKNGANVNAEGGEYGNALQAASARGHQEMARLLIKNGANVNAQGGVFSNALQAASVSGHAVVARLLLENHANVNAEGGYFGNALQAASAHGHEPVACLLLENHADVNAEGGYYRNTLQAACVHGHQAVVLLLLKHAANVNSEDGIYGSAIEAALDNGHAAIVQMLIEASLRTDSEETETGHPLRDTTRPISQAIIKQI